MNSVSGIARSGLQIESLRLAASANNVANASTDGFVPGRVEAQEVREGGVVGQVAKENDPQVESRIDRAIIGLSGTDLVKETVNQTLAAASFRANLATLRTADETLGSLLSLES